MSGYKANRQVRFKDGNIHNHALDNLEVVVHWSEAGTGTAPAAPALPAPASNQDEQRVNSRENGQ